MTMPLTTRPATMTDVPTLVALMTEFYGEAGFALPPATAAGAVGRGVRALCVETGGGDHPARALYARAGYVDSGHTFLILPLAAPVHAS